MTETFEQQVAAEVPKLRARLGLDAQERPIADFRVEVFVGTHPTWGFRDYRVVLTGTETGLTGSESSPVPQWALLRAWLRLAKELKRRARAGELPRSLEAARGAARPPRSQKSD